MPKMKTVSSAKKRFKLTATGKVKRKKAYHSHLLTKKSKDRKKRLVSSTIVDKADRKRVLNMLTLK